MSLHHAFRSALAKDARSYVAHKQVMGRRFDTAVRILAHLDSFLAGMNNRSADLTADTFRKWRQSLEHLSPNTKIMRMRTVMHFCLYRRRLSPGCFVPDPSQFPKGCPPVRPYFFSEAEVARLLHRCDAMPEDAARSPLRWTGTRLAIVLLYATGLRRGELFRLTPQDYDSAARTLLIRASKFHKSRLLPLPGDIAGEVERHLQARGSAYPGALPTEPLLWSPFRQDRSYSSTRLRANLNVLFGLAGIEKQDGSRPRIHDFRHGFAVNALIRWYRGGADVQAKLPLLAAWMGHVSILSTYHYLHFVDELRQTANDRFTNVYGGLVVPWNEKSKGKGRKR